MPKINVVKPFTFNKPDGSTFEFKPGVNEIDDETAKHPWIKAGADGCIGSNEVVSLATAAAAAEAKAKADADAKAKAAGGATKPGAG